MNKLKIVAIGAGVVLGLVGVLYGTLRGTMESMDYSRADGNCVYATEHFGLSMNKVYMHKCPNSIELRVVPFFGQDYELFDNNNDGLVDKAVVGTRIYYRQEDPAELFNKADTTLKEYLDKFENNNADWRDAFSW
ncbi:MAG: hypothetical protein V1734_00375 [Nanoarchaeota archaeon]